MVEINPWGDGVPTGVWVFTALYLVVLFVIGAYYGNKLRTGEREVSAKDHFLAGKNLGMITTTLSLYAVCWSGYAWMGNPGETYIAGFTAFRKVPGNVNFACFIGWMAPRIHFYAHKRDYEGTADFISDRFRNSTLTLTIVFLQIFPVCLYVMGQLKGIGTTMSSMSGGELNEFSGALILVVLMLFYEMLGGMYAIAKTDVIQAIILLFGFLLYFIFQSTVFGGLPVATEAFLNCARLYDDDLFYPAINYSFSDLSGSAFLVDLSNDTSWVDGHKDSETLTDNYTYNIFDYYSDNNTNLKQGYMTIKNANDGDGNNNFIYLRANQTKDCKLTPGNVIEPANAKDHLTINDHKLAGWVRFYISSIPFIVYPHVMDRYYAAKDVKTLKMALQLIHISVWISAMPAVLIGMPLSVFVKGDSNMTNIKDSNRVYATLLKFIINQNLLMYILGCMTCAAAFSAYMSTADSAIMGFSSMLSLDVLKHYMPPFNDSSDKKKRQKYIVIAGRVFSVIGALIALLLVTVYPDFPLADLYDWQGGFIFQSFPAFFLGMFVPWVCSYSIVIGCWVGFMVIVTMNQNVNDTILPNVFYSLVANVGCIFLWEAILRISNNHPGFEPNLKPEFHGFGKMDEGFIGLDMSKVGGPKNEPFRPLWASFFVLFLVFLAIPYWASSDNYDVDYIAGMPYWLAQTLFLGACASTITILQCTFFYDDWTEDIKLRKMLKKKEPAETSTDL